MTAGVRLEIALDVPLADIYSWLRQQHRAVGQDLAVHLRGSRMLLGMPAAAARAVTCNIQLFEPGEAVLPLLSGRLRAILEPHRGTISLTFDGAHRHGSRRGRMSAWPPAVDGDGSRLAGELLDLIARGCESAYHEPLTA